MFQYGAVIALKAVTRVSGRKFHCHFSLNWITTAPACRVSLM
jgi:hypothetical protein